MATTRRADIFTADGKPPDDALNEHASGASDGDTQPLPGSSTPNGASARSTRAELVDK